MLPTRGAAMARAHSTSSSGISTDTEGRSPKPPLAPRPVPFSPPKASLERDDFFRLYQVFCNLTGQEYQEVIIIRRYQLDIHELWSAVRQQGGYKTVNVRKLWAATARSFHHPPNWTNSSYYFRTAYEQLGLHKMEAMVDAGALPLSSTPLQQSDPQGPSALQLNMQPHNPRLQALPDEVTQFPDSMMDSVMSLDDVDYNHLQQQQQQQQQMSVSMDWTSFLNDTDQDDQQQQQQQQQQRPRMPTQAAQAVHNMPTAAAAAAARAVEPAAAAAAAAFGDDGGGGHQGGAGRSMPAFHIPGTIEVSCGAVSGMYDVLRQRIACMCDACLSTAGPDGLDMSPIEFERHGGWETYKKWKNSITVKATGRSLGLWLRDHGIEVLSQATRTRRARMAARSRTHGRDTIADLAAATAGTAAAAASGFVLPAAVASRTHSGPYSSLNQQQQQQQQPWQSMQWQLAAEVPPSNNLAGMTNPHPQPHLTTPTAAQAEAEAPSMQWQLAASGQSGVSESTQGCVPVGDRLVGCSVETWSHLDSTWFPAAVEAYDPVSQLYLLRFDDGELETLDLAAEQWRMADITHNSSSTSQQQQQQQQQQQPRNRQQQQQQQAAPGPVDQHNPPPPSAAAAADCRDRRVTGGVSGQVPEGSESEGGVDESSWWEEAQVSLRERPLRVVLDSLTGCLRVLLASDVLQAELHMRQQQRLQQQQQGRQTSASGGNQNSSSQSRDRAPHTAASAERSAGDSSHIAAAGAGRVAVSPFAAAAAAAAAAAGAAAGAAADRANNRHATASPSLQFDPAAAAAQATRRSQRTMAAALRPPRPPAAHPSRPIPAGVAAMAATTAPAAAAAAAAAGGVSVPEVPVDVVCNSKHGTYLIKANGVVCHCVSCVEQHAQTGSLMAWSPAEFERHAGMGGSRKWRNSIKIILPDKKRMSIGTWLVHYEQQRVQQRVAQQQQQELLRAQQQQQGGAADSDQQQQQQQQVLDLSQIPGTLAVGQSMDSMFGVPGAGMFESSSQQQQQQQQQQQLAGQQPLPSFPTILPNLSAGPPGVDVPVVLAGGLPMALGGGAVGKGLGMLHPGAAAGGGLCEGQGGDPNQLGWLPFSTSFGDAPWNADSSGAAGGGGLGGFGGGCAGFSGGVFGSGKRTAHVAFGGADDAFLGL